MSLPRDYAERVYAGVLGKLIGVFMGRPFEGWPYERITRELGEVSYYVNDRFGQPLVVTDDDVSGTFTFPRALPDYGHPRDLTPGQIGQTWLNYLVERRTTLWWGGMGNSTEHTAYLRLKHGIAAPASGSAALNGKITAEQIGAQIFIDGWAMIAPGDPELAADFARRAASVSHDGEAIYGAQVVAAMEAQAFVESDIGRLIDTALRCIPADSLIRRLIDDLRDWQAGEPNWRVTRQRIADHYGYDKYAGVCHMIPNHALIILSLLYGGGDFQRSLTIVNTSGWDTDCNSGNVGCLLGIRGGLAAFDGGPDWRGPIGDRMLLSTADGGRAVTDAVAETYRLVNIGRTLAGQPSDMPKQGARFHFDLPGALQGFHAGPGLTLANVVGYSRHGGRVLALRYSGAGKPATATTPTFEPSDANALPPYPLAVSPSLYPGQMVRAGLMASADNSGPVECRLVARSFDADDAQTTLYGPPLSLQPGASGVPAWTIGDTGGAPIAEIGVEVSAPGDAVVYLDFLRWDGPPNVRLTRPAGSGVQWRRAWVNAVDHFDPWWEPFRIAQDEGRGLLIQGTREWVDYAVSADVTPHLVGAAGVAARVQGLRRYYALLLYDDGSVRLSKALDGETELARAEIGCRPATTYALRLEVSGARLRASVDNRLLFDVEDSDRPLLEGAVALVCQDGCLSANVVTVAPV